MNMYLSLGIVTVSVLLYGTLAAMDRGISPCPCFDGDESRLSMPPFLLPVMSPGPEGAEPAGEISPTGSLEEENVMRQLVHTREALAKLELHALFEPQNPAITRHIERLHAQLGDLGKEYDDIKQDRVMHDRLGDPLAGVPLVEPEYVDESLVTGPSLDELVKLRGKFGRARCAHRTLIDALEQERAPYRRAIKRAAPQDFPRVRAHVQKLDRQLARHKKELEHVTRAYDDVVAQIGEEARVLYSVL